MKRIDLEWQARWEMLKDIIEITRKKLDEKSDIREAFDTMLQMMGMLEKVEQPCLSRDIVEYRSPMTGDPRAIFETLPVSPELPDKKKEIPS